MIDSYRYPNLGLDDLEIQARWLAASHFIAGLSNKYYGNRQKFGDCVQGRVRDWYELPITEDGQRSQAVHHDRLLAFTDFLRNSEQQTDIWVLVATYKIRFASVEYVRTQSDKGIAHNLLSKGRSSADTLVSQTLAQAASILEKYGVTFDEDNLFTVLFETAKLKSHTFRVTDKWRRAKLEQVRRWLTVYNMTHTMELSETHARTSD